MAATGFAAALPLNAQQAGLTGQQPLAFVDSATVPAGYTIVSVDGAGNAVIETTHNTILKTSPYPYSYDLGPITPRAPRPQFNITADGRMDWKSPPMAPTLQGSPHVAGKTDLEAGLAALNDGSNGGCAYVMCSWYGAESTAYAGPCAKPLQDLGNIVRNQGWQAVPACKGTSLTYNPASCAPPWQLVNKGNWQEHACRAMTNVGPSAPSPAEVTARTIAQDFINHDAPITPQPNPGCSWSVTGTHWSPAGVIPVNVQVDCNGYPTCWSEMIPVREYAMQACSGAQFREILNWLFYAHIAAIGSPGFDGGGGAGN